MSGENLTATTCSTGNILKAYNPVQKSLLFLKKLHPDPVIVPTQLAFFAFPVKFLKLVSTSCHHLIIHHLASTSCNLLSILCQVSEIALDQDMFFLLPLLTSLLYLTLLTMFFFLKLCSPLGLLSFLC